VPNIDERWFVIEDVTIGPIAVQYAVRNNTIDGLVWVEGEQESEEREPAEE
jgi:hypothetical protein